MKKIYLFIIAIIAISCENSKYVEDDNQQQILYSIEFTLTECDVNPDTGLNTYEYLFKLPYSDFLFSPKQKYSTAYINGVEYCQNSFIRYYGYYEGRDYFENKEIGRFSYFDYNLNIEPPITVKIEFYEYR